MLDTVLIVAAIAALAGAVYFGSEPCPFCGSRFTSIYGHSDLTGKPIFGCHRCKRAF